MDKLKAAVIVPRVSTSPQAEKGTSMETQELACLRKAAELGAPIHAIYKDDGVSGGLYLTRTGIQQALADIEAGRAHYLIVANLQRAGRDVEILRDIRRRVTSAGGEFVFADGMQFDRNATGDLMFTQISAYAEYERAQILERTHGGRTRRAQQGIQPYRTISPFGYHVATTNDVLSGRATTADLGIYRVNEEEARWVREIFQRFASGSSLRGLGAYLHSQGVPTPRGGRCWHSSTLRLMLKNPVYKGEAACGKTETIRDERRKTEMGMKHVHTLRATDPDRWITIPCPALVSVELWDQCQRLLATNQATRSGNPDRTYLLTGMVRCPICNLRMFGCTVTHDYTTYFCRAAGRAEHPNYIGFPAKRVEAAIPLAMEYVLAEPESLEAAFAAFEEEMREADSAPRQSDIERMEAAVADLEKREAVAARAQVDAMMQGRSTEVYDGILRECHELRQSITAQMAALRPRLHLTGGRRQFDPSDARFSTQRAMAALRTVLYSDKLTKAERREGIAAFVESIHPTQESIEVRFKHFHDEQTVHNVQV